MPMRKQRSKPLRNRSCNRCGSGAGKVSRLAAEVSLLPMPFRKLRKNGTDSRWLQMRKGHSPGREEFSRVTVRFQAVRLPNLRIFWPADEAHALLFASRAYQ